MTTAPAGHQTKARDGNTLRNALLGAVVTVVTAPLLPLAALFGGGVAGYLECGTVEESAAVGAMSGAIAAIPAFFVVWILVAVLALGGLELFGVASLVGGMVFVGVLGYLVVAGAVGGALGAFARAELR